MWRSVEHVYLPAVPSGQGRPFGKKMFEFRMFDTPPHGYRAFDTILAYSPYLRLAILDVPRAIS
jgi:hypothetical protein